MPPTIPDRDRALSRATCRSRHLNDKTNATHALTPHHDTKRGPRPDHPFWRGTDGRLEIGMGACQRRIHRRLASLASAGVMAAAACVALALKAGKNAFGASYDGGGDFAPSTSATQYMTIAKAKTSTTLQLSHSSINLRPRQR
jgi:hypothetical protein